MQYSSRYSQFGLWLNSAGYPCKRVKASRQRVNWVSVFVDASSTVKVCIQTELAIDCQTTHTKHSGIFRGRISPAVIIAGKRPFEGRVEKFIVDNTSNNLNGRRL